jgi:RecA-family ATPase
MKKLNYDFNYYIFRDFANPADWQEFLNTDFNHLPEISFIESVSSTETHSTDLEEVFEIIRDGTFADTISSIRQTEDREERTKLKKLLPAILFGGKFKARKELVESSNLICIDFDHIENISRYAFRLPFYSFIYGFFVSPSGNGLKVLVRTDVENKESYNKVIKQLMASFKSIGLEADSSKQNITDLCFLSYDPNAYFNPTATIWRPNPFTKEYDTWDKDQIQTSVDYIINQIQEKKIDITGTYENWFIVCCSLADHFGEEGRDYFHQVSQFYKDYNADECDKQFDYVIDSKRDGYTIRSFFKIALENSLLLSKKNVKAPIIIDAYDQAFYTGEDLLLRKTDQLPTLLTPILPKVGLVALGGSSDVGKSTFLRHLAISICCGAENFIQLPINATHNRVIYVSTEDDDLAMGFLLDLQNKGLKMPSSSYKNLVYLFDTSNLIPQLEKMLQSDPVDLIIIDTFSDLYSGDLNQSNKVRSFLQNYSLLAKKYQCLILMLHHTGKRTEDLTPSKNNLLGSQGFEAKMRLVLELRTDKDDPTNRHLCVVKGNYIAKQDKETSYVLRFNENMLFENTGLRVPFNELTRSKKDREEEKKKWIELAIPLIKDGKTYQEVSEILKESGFNVSKSTIQRELTK